MATKKPKAKVNASETAGTTQDSEKVKAAAAKQEAQEKAQAEKKAAAEKAAKEKADKAAAALKAKEEKAAAVAKEKADKAAANAKAQAEKTKARAEAQAAVDKAKELEAEARAKVKAARDAARAVGGANGSAKGVEALKKHAPDYIRDKEHKTAKGNASVHCGDEVAQKLLGKSLDEAYVITSKVLKGEEGASEAELRKKYGHLNVGMQRMNLGNRMRGVLNAK